MPNFVDITRKLILVVSAGVTESGDIKTKSYTFNNLSEEASANAVMQAAEAIGSLMGSPVLNYFVNDKNEVLDNE